MFTSINAVLKQLNAEGWIDIDEVSLFDIY